MLASNSKAVLRVTCSLLSELAIDPDGAEMIRHTSNLQPLGGLMENSDSHICKFNRAIFYKCSTFVLNFFVFAPQFHPRVPL